MKKNGKKLLWILLAVLAVAAIATVAVLALLPGEAPEQVDERENYLYWNVERARYVAQGYQGASSRVPNSDGCYYVNMAVNGQQMEVPVKDPALINRIDFQEVMGLVFDEEGYVVDIRTVDEFTGGIAADKYSVVSINGYEVVCNSSNKYKGMEVTYQLDENTKIWQIGDFEPMVGVPTVIAKGDRVLMIRDLDGRIRDVFVFPFVPPGDVYWNINRMYDNDSQCTTRERDATGYYVYEFAVNGEIKTLRTKDQAIANYIDKHVSQSMGFVFDDAGDIIEVLNAGNYVCGGGLLCNRYMVTQLDGDQATFQLNSTVYSATISAECKFFDVSGNADYIGQPVDGIRLGDRVTVLKDRRDQACVIFITGRLTDNDIYWVVERNQVWNRTTWTTNRKPAADGWYYIKLAGNGKQITAKTRDAALVNELDSYVCWCVELNGDQIVKIQDASSRYGGSLFGAFNKLETIDGNTLTIEKNGKLVSAQVADDCLVYNVSTNSTYVGEPSKLRAGDTIYGFTDLDGVVRYVFITSTTYNGRIYWNVNRFYDNNLKVTTREKAADGYYHFEMVCDGKVVWLKTASKDIATKIDLVVTRARGLKVVGDVIVDVLAPNVLTNYRGVKPDASWVTVQTVDGNKITALNSKKETVNITLSPYGKVYNVTSAYESHRGELTTVQPGDVLVTLVNEAKQAVITYVCGGRTKSFHTDPQDCACADKPVWKPWDGTTELITGGYYYLTADVTAPEGGYILDAETIHLRLDGHVISGPGKIFDLYNGAVLRVCDHGTRGAIVGMGMGSESGGVIQIRNSSVTVDLYNIDVYAQGGTMDNGGVLATSGWMSLYNVNVYGGVANKKGGNVVVMPTGTLRMFGGSVTGGSAVVDGNNVFVAGNAYFENVTMDGGLSLAAEGMTAHINGGKICGGDYGVLLQSGTLQLSGDVQILDNAKMDLNMAGGTSLDVQNLSTQAKIGLETSQSGTFAIHALTDLTPVFQLRNADLSVFYAEQTQTMELKFAHSHCICNDLAGHQCAALGFGKLTQDMFTNATASSSPVRVSGTNYRISAGDYYLAEDIVLTGQIIVNDQVNLCLNGHSLSATQSRVFAISGGTLQVTDCGENGKIVGGKASTAATILLQTSTGGIDGSAGTLNLYAGTIQGGTTTETKTGFAANIYITGGTMNVYGGKLIGGTAVGQGGNVMVAAGQTLNLYGGEMTSGTSPKGNCLYVVSGAKVTLDGIAVLDEIYLSGAMLNLGSLAEGFTTKLISSQSGVFAENVAQDYSGCFEVENLSVIYDEETQTLRLEKLVTGEHVHCICNGFDGHSCADQAWVGLTQADFDSGSFSMEEGTYYYLKESITLTKAITVGSEKTLNLCLNNCTITAPAKLRVFVVNGGTVNLTDCGEQGALVATSTNNGAAVYIQGKSGASGIKGAFHLYGGTIRGGSGTNGGAIYVAWGNLGIYGGTVQGGTVTNAGAAIFVAANQTMDFFGGTITAGSANTKANCVLALAGSTVTLGGDIHADEIYLNDTVKLHLSQEHPLADTARVGVKMNTPGVLADNVESYTDGTLLCNNAGKVILWDSQSKQLLVTDPV